MFWCQDCENCGSCWFVRDCVGCHECFLCTGLRNKKYCFLNEQLTEKEYTAKIVEFDTGSNAMIEKAKMLFQKLQSQHTYKHLHNIMCENVTGNHLTRCKDVSNCFDCTEVQDSKHCFQVQFNVKNCYDLYQYGIDQSFCYETDMAGIQVNNLRFCHTTNTVASDCDYCIYTR